MTIYDLINELNAIANQVTSTHIETNVTGIDAALDGESDEWVIRFTIDKTK